MKEGTPEFNAPLMPTQSHSPELENAVRQVMKAHEELERLRTELATLRKAIDDRRVVEGFCVDNRGMYECSAPHHCVHIRYPGNSVCFVGSLDDAFHEAAEWVRGQS